MMVFKRLTVASHRLSSALRFLVISTVSWALVEEAVVVVDGAGAGADDDAAASVDEVAMAVVVADGDDITCWLIETCEA